MRPLSPSAAGGAAVDGGRPRVVEHTVEDRWLRAFAAAVGDTSPPLFDLDAAGGIVAHPVFPVCLEWPLVAAGPPGFDLDAGAVHAGLHVSHEIAWHRPIRPGDALTTSVALETIEQRSIGAFVSFAFTTVAAGGAPVVETRQQVLYRGSELAEPSGAPPAGRDAEARAPLVAVAEFGVEEADAIVYMECSGIWNPIHTDPRAARAAGLPSPVNHGTATLARVISALLATRLGADPTRVRRLGCRFAAPVAPGEQVTVTASEPAGSESSERVEFGAVGADGTTLIDRGTVELGAPARPSLANG